MRLLESRHPWWLVTLAAVGLVAIVSVVVTLFTGVGRGPDELWTTSAPPVDSPEFLAAVAGAAGAPIGSGGTVQLLDNGDEFFPALDKDLRAARSTITFAVYIWEKGQASDRVFAALVDRARAGVQVRVLMDGLGGAPPEESVKALRAAGGRVETFRAPRFGKLTRYHKRNHRRAIVIDGAVAFTGGEAVADKWLGHADSEEHWRDSMVRVTGPMAVTLQSAFVPLWAHSTGELLAGPGFFPPAGHPAGSPLSAGGGGPPPILHVGLASAPSHEDHPLRLFLGQSVLSARRTLSITTPYFVPDEGTRRAVAGAARRGVDVRILLPDEHTDAKPIRQTSHHYYDELLSAGVRIYEYQTTMMHTKHIVVDGRWSIVGSANMDVRSQELNAENVLGILDTAFAQRLEATFRDDLQRSHEIRLDEWRRRGRGARFKEWLFSRFAEQY